MDGLFSNIPVNTLMFVTLTVTCCSPDCIYDEDIIHHDDDPGQAAEDEDHGDHDQHQRESLLAFTEVTDTSPPVKR